MCSLDQGVGVGEWCGGKQVSGSLIQREVTAVLAEGHLSPCYSVHSPGKMFASKMVDGGVFSSLFAVI